VICGVALSAAAVSAWQGQRPWLPTGAEVEEVKARPEAVRRIRATAHVDAQGLLERTAAGAVVIDARPADQFALGHFDALAHGGGLPTLNIPPEHVDEHLDRLSQLLMYTQELTLYCTSETCDLAEDLYLAIEARQLPFAMKIYPPGWEGVQKEGFSVAAGADTWNGEDPGTVAALQGLEEPSAGGELESPDGDVPSDDNP